MPVVLDSLQGRFLVLSLRKRPGFEDADVLDAPLPPSGALLAAADWALPRLMHLGGILGNLLETKYD